LTSFSRAAVVAFDRAAAILACVILVGLLGCVTLGVITRAVGSPLIWTDELSRFLMVWLAVFGWVLASRRRIQVRIRFFQDLLPPAGHRRAELGIQLAMLVFGSLIGWYSIGLVIKNHDLEATSLPISMSWMYVPMVLAGFVTAAQGLAETIETLVKIRAAKAIAE
jgi:TRAP-type C4-dicarboxylate transport system permease small subunit